jgi:hypothetical protein
VQNPGIVSTVRGLRVARTTAVVPVADRQARCAGAADDLGAFARLARYPEAYVYELWGWMVRGARDPVRASQLVAAHPESQQLVRDLYLEHLARRGRVAQLAVAAQELRAADVGALWLAIIGRPIAALELAATARLHTPELACARALACFRAGRPDLTDRILADDLPPTEVASDTLSPFPGPHERWVAAANARPAVSALAGGRAGVVALAQPAPEGAERDTASLEPIAAIARRLGRALSGATVYLAGVFDDRASVLAALVAKGARVVGGPVPGTDFYVRGRGCTVYAIAQLERKGTRRLRIEELGLS